MSVISQTKSALRCSEIRSKEISDLAFSIPPLHQYCATSRPVRCYYITTESKTKMLPHEPVHQQLYYLWPLHTYINRISVILTLCYFYMNTKEVRFVLCTRHRLSWVGLGWKGEHWVGWIRCLGRTRRGLKVKFSSFSSKTASTVEKTKKNKL